MSTSPAPIAGHRHLFETHIVNAAIDRGLHPSEEESGYQEWACFSQGCHNVVLYPTPIAKQSKLTRTRVPSACLATHSCIFARNRFSSRLRFLAAMPLSFANRATGSTVPAAGTT